MITQELIFQQIILRIIKEQELIIGPMAFDEANKVEGLIVDKNNNIIKLSNEPRGIINKLVSRYKNLFGEASKEVCKEAVKDLIPILPKEEVPDSLI